MNVFTKHLRERMLAVVFLLALAMGLGTTSAEAQLCTSSCFPTFYYGCMSIDEFTVNGDYYSNYSCGSSDVGTTSDNTGKSFDVMPGSTVNWDMVAGDYYGSYYDGYYLIFVDWNNDNNWTKVSPDYWDNYMYYGTSGSFDVPANVTAGPKRMRVMFHYYYYYPIHALA